MKPDERIAADGLQFIGEQIGPSESLLKRELEPILLEGHVVRAYLAIISIRGRRSVGLCLRRSGGADALVVRSISEAFASTFAENQHLDIFFLSESQETALSKVCEPFFRA